MPCCRFNLLILPAQRWLKLRIFISHFDRIPSVFVCLNFLIALPYRPYSLRSERIQLLFFPFFFCFFFFKCVFMSRSMANICTYIPEAVGPLRENSFQYHTIFGFCRMPRSTQISATTTKAWNSFHHFGGFCVCAGFTSPNSVRTNQCTNAFRCWIILMMPFLRSVLFFIAWN